MTSWVKVGAKCVCIKKGEWSLGSINSPSCGDIVTIRSSYMGTNGRIYLVFHEISNRPRLLAAGFLEPGFWSEQFRPMLTKTQEQDVSMFLSLLSNTPQSADA